MGAFTYPRSEPGSAGHQDLVERLNAVPGALKTEVSDLPEEALTHRPGEGDWSIKEVLGHLCDAGAVLQTRLYRMINQEEPRLPSWDQEERQRERNAQDKLIQDLLHEFSSQRAETVDMLSELVHWNWARPGRHEERGRLSIRQLVELALAHEEDQHLPQLRRLKEQAAAAPANS
ncbi:MAG: DinB family protein [Chloroflexi bacterium]|nr:DinB family protein [Chloroflexota bacterium]